MTIVHYVQCDTCKRKFYEESPPVYGRLDTPGEHECVDCLLGRAQKAVGRR